MAIAIVLVLLQFCCCCAGGWTSFHVGNFVVTFVAATFIAASRMERGY